MDENDEWIVVRKPTKNKKSKKKSHVTWAHQGPVCQTQKSEEYKYEFLNSPSYQHNYQTVKESIQSLMKNSLVQINLQCLGLGDFIHGLKSRFQYYFLTEVLLKIFKELGIKVNLNVYDPIFSSRCIEQIESIGGTVTKKQGQELLETNLYFMPHCERWLYQKICSIHREEVFMIGNSIAEYVERCKLISEEVPKEFRNKKPKEIKLMDFRESLNDTFMYMI